MSLTIKDYNSTNTPTWCPGCGNFALHASLKKALVELNISPSELFMSFDIGCNGNGADKINVYGFKGLHGRSIPLAVGAHLANRRFTVIADIGDGACFHEGIDHLIHAVKANYNITILIHNNQNFALTTGQATVSTQEEKPMYGLPKGRPERSLNVSKFILCLDPSFYARGTSTDPLQLSEIIKSGIENNGCSVIEVIQICPKYNKDFSPEWAIQNIKKTDSLENYNNLSLKDATEILDNSSIYTGIIYRNNTLKSFYERVHNRKDTLTELVDEVKIQDTAHLLKYFE